jgi:hypothetical protein
LQDKDSALERDISISLIKRGKRLKGRRTTCEKNSFKRVVDWSPDRAMREIVSPLHLQERSTGS